MENSNFVNVDFTNLDSKDLNMYYCGHRKNSPGHSYGPAMRDHHLMVYVADGSGVYEINNKRYAIQAKSIFVVFPNCKVYYESDMNAPWETIWIGLYGNSLKQYLRYTNLSIENPIFSLNENHHIELLLFKLLEQAQIDLVEAQVQSIGLLYQIISEMIFIYSRECEGQKSISSKDRYVEKAVNFINFNYNRSITCSDVANHVNLDRSYFSKLFTESMHISPTEYLIKYRMEKASRLLLQTDLCIADIAYSVGIHDQFYFSRLFKKYYEISPLKFRGPI